MELIPIPFSIIATITDIKERKIRNRLTYLFIMLGIMYGYITHGLNGVENCFMGIVLNLAVLSLIPGFRFGGGDKKMMMGFGAFIGISSFKFILIFLINLLILNIALLIWKDGIKNFFYNIKFELLTLCKSSSIKEYKIPGAPIMLMSYIIFLFL